MDCLNCSINRNLTYCCHRHPVTGESVPLKLYDGRTVNACPELDEDGLCSTYESRPEICVSYHCDETFDMVDFVRRRNMNPGFICGDFKDEN